MKSANFVLLQILKLKDLNEFNYYNRRYEFFAALKTVYYETTNENLPVFGVPAGKLKDYSTSKKDMKRGVEIIPEETYRIRSEDIYTPRKDF